MNAEEMSGRILGLIESKGYAAFDEILESVGPEAKGDLRWQIGDTNLVLWDGISETLADAFRLLQSQIEPVPTHALTYLYGGCERPSLPLARGGRKYKRPHWAPVVLKLKQD